MLVINRREIEYYSHDLGMSVKHYILIAQSDNKNILLSHPNLFLYSHTRSSIPTSSRYSNIISMFYRYLSTLERFQGIHVGRYHALATNKDIRNWQVARQVEREKKQNPRPSSETIFEEAKVLLVYFRWLISSGYVTNVDVILKTWVANFKNQRMLNYIKAKARTTIDSKNIQVLDRERRQKKQNSLITKNEIYTYLASFYDPVYAAMFKLALGTAMRPMDLCKFPYIGNGDNKHIMPFSEMDSTLPTVLYDIQKSKGNKSRTIVINTSDLRELEAGYITPYYSERKEKYKKKYGKPCPPSVLFLNNQGEPVIPKMVSNRGTDAKKKAMKSDPTFRSSVVFYSSRAWWPTMYLIKFFKEDILTDKASAMYAAVAQVLISQLGHEDLDTTYKHYIDSGRILMLAHQGRMNELITAPDESVAEFIGRMDGASS